MDKRHAVTSCLLLTAAAATAQTAQTQIIERPLPQWLTGIIAVSIFLFLAFVSFLVKKAWCDKPSRRRSPVEEPGRDTELVTTNGNTYSTALDVVRSKDNMNAYDNLVIESTDDRVTPM